MNNLYIEQTDNSPKVHFDFRNGVLDFEHKSYPENTFDFYEPILAWMEEYFSGKAQDITYINFKLTYFNSATAQTLFDILDIVQDGQVNKLDIKWYYDAKNENGLDDYNDYSAEFEDLKIKAVRY